jgi:hypothetical protein
MNQLTWSKPRRRGQSTNRVMPAPRAGTEPAPAPQPPARLVGRFGVARPPRAGSRHVPGGSATLEAAPRAREASVVGRPRSREMPVAAAARPMLCRPSPTTALGLRQPTGIPTPRGSSLVVRLGQWRRRRGTSGTHRRRSLHPKHWRATHPPDPRAASAQALRQAPIVEGRGRATRANDWRVPPSTAMEHPGAGAPPRQGSRRRPTGPGRTAEKGRRRPRAEKRPAERRGLPGHGWEAEHPRQHFERRVP